MSENFGVTTYLENGNYVPNDTTPLLCTQANLWIAFKFMEQNSI